MASHGCLLLDAHLPLGEDLVLQAEQSLHAIAAHLEALPGSHMSISGFVTNAMVTIVTVIIGVDFCYNNQGYTFSRF